MDGWAEFAVITGGAAAALVGLPLTIFLGLLAAAILISLPNPALWVLGVELVAAALITAAAHIVLNHRAEADERKPLERILDRLNPNITTAVLIGLSGITLLFGVEAGLFLLALAALVGFVGGAIGAWLVLVRPEG